MATVNGIVGDVKQNLGNRSSGVIGGTPVDTVCLNAVNKGFKNIIKQANPDYYDRIVTLNITTATNEYAMPTVDTDGNTVKVKQIVSGRLVRTGEYNAYRVREVIFEEYFKFNEPNALETGVPSTFALRNNKLYFVKYPDDAYTLTLAVQIVPTDIPVSGINKLLGIDDVWVEVIEAYATHYCFAKLQQMADANYWYAKYLELKKEAKGTQYKRPMQNKPNNYSIGSGDPELDPFVKRWN